MSDKGYARPTMRSRELRANATDAERKLWAQLSARKVAGVRFNTQFAIGSFICDFVSRTAKLVIEIDGGQHDWNAAADLPQTRFIEGRGFVVLRFWNNEVLENIEGVVATIERALADRPSPSPATLLGGVNHAPGMSEGWLGAIPARPSRVARKREGSRSARPRDTSS